MNFIEEFKKGQAGGNKGLYMGDGLANVSKAIGGVQKHRIYGIASGPKVGKSTTVDYGFVIQPYLYALENGIDAEWIYYSFEIDRVSKEFDFAIFFLYHDYGIEKVSLPEGVTIKGESIVAISPDYLRGRMVDDNDQTITVKEEIYSVLKLVYTNRIIPMFGEWSAGGLLIKPGAIKFIEQKDNPTGIYKDLKSHAEQVGHFVKGPSGRVLGYKNTLAPDRYTIIIMDHLRKLIPERGWQLKQTVDKMSEYMVELRNWCDYTFVPIIHTNRNLADAGKMSFSGDELYPSGDDIKDTGNLSEDVDHLFTMMNPNDTKYKLKKHFGVELKDSKGFPYYPNLRTIHLVESRHVPYPRHFKVNMFGNTKSFQQIEL